VEVINVNEFDDEGEVFGRPDQIELDVIIKNGLLILCELKSSMSKSDMHIFERKVRFYERRHGRQATRMIVVSPMIDDPARQVGTKLGSKYIPIRWMCRCSELLFRLFHRAYRAQGIGRKGMRRQAGR